MEKKKLKISVINHLKTEGHVSYTLKFETEDGLTFKSTKRYSELKTLHDSLRKETNSTSFPKFPPKKFFGFSNEDFINKRQQELNLFFEGICNSPEFSKLKSFKIFIDSCKKAMKDTKKIDVAQKVEKKDSNYLKKTMSNRTMINSFREKLRPEKKENKRLNQEEIKNMENEFNSIVEDITKKYISINFEAELNANQKNEVEYVKIIKEDKNLGNEEKNENIEPGNDDNFNLVSEDNEYFDGLEKEIKQKMDASMNKRKEIEKLYDINEILKIL